MIADAKFERGITLLQQHFNRTLSEDVIAIWREYLDDTLDDEEFTQAIKEAILSCEFFPTAKKLAEFVNGSKEAKASQEWQSVILAANRGDESQLAYISQRGRVALHAIGGLKTVGLAEEYKRNQLEKSFVTVYCQCTEKDAKALSPATSQPLAAKSDEEFTPVPEDLKRQMEQLKAKLSLSRQW